MQMWCQIYDAMFLFLEESLEYLLYRNLLLASEPFWTLWTEGKSLCRAGNHALIAG
jgi:hypothetical protein